LTLSRRSQSNAKNAGKVIQDLAGKMLSRSQILYFLDFYIIEYDVRCSKIVLDMCILEVEQGNAEKLQDLARKDP